MSSRKRRGRIFWLFAAVAMIVAVMPLAGAAANGAVPFRVDLIADGGSNATAVTVGYVEVTNDATHLTVKYVVNEPNWCLTDTHLDVATDPGLFPQTKKGNPKIGHFEYGEADLGCATEWTSPAIPLADGPYIAAHAVVRDTVSNVIYGIELTTADLYSIDLASCSATKIADFVNSSNKSYPNSLAYDGDNDRLFYAGGPGAASLYVYEDGVSTAVPGFTLPTALADAAWYDGHYYFVTHSLSASGQLYKVDVAFTLGVPTGATAVQVGAVGASIYGDIAIDSSGMLYGSNAIAPGDYTFFSVDLNTSNPAAWLGDTAVPYQLAYDGLGRLIGTATTTASGVTAGVMYELSTTDGSSIDTVCSTPLGRYTDLSDGPGVEYRWETAWGGNWDDGIEGFVPSFSDSSWAGYFQYIDTYPGTTFLKPGWDIFPEGATGTVDWAVTGSDHLIVTYTVAGAQPNTVLDVGLIQTDVAEGAMVTGVVGGSFDFQGLGIGPFPREGEVVGPYNAWIFGEEFTTDGSGDGTVTVNLITTDGTWDVQFIVLPDTTTTPSQESAGVFGTTVEVITIP